MKPTDQFVLSSDVTIFPVAELAPAVRVSIEAVNGDWGITKQNSRRTTRVIDKAAADLLKEFRSPSSVPEAIARFSQSADMTAGKVLDASFDLLSKMVRDRFLVLVSSPARMAAVDTVGDWRVLEPLRLLDDTEVYLVSSSTHERGVLKRVSPDADRWVRMALVNEARILRKLDGTCAPALLEDGSTGASPYLVVSWCPGLTSSLVCAQLRRPWVPGSRAHLAGICSLVLDAYVELHAHGILHGDIQPGNVLVDIDANAVSLVDFGLAADSDGRPSSTGLRGGVQALYPPEWSRAVLANEPLPPVTSASEQYGVAVLLYQLFTGRNYLEQRLDAKTWHDTVCTCDPLPFVRLGMPPWPRLEAVLGRALAKDPGERYPSMAAFGEDFSAIAHTDDGTNPTRAATPSWQPPGFFQTTLARLTDPSNVIETRLAPPSANLNFGATGIAYFLYRASGILNRPDLFAAADLWIERARREAAAHDVAFYDDANSLNEDTVGRSALYHSAVGMHCVDALIACSADERQRLAASVDELILAANISESRADLATGFAGHLIACATLLEALAALGFEEEREALVALGQRRREDLLRVWMPVDHRLPGASEAYFGVAHGWAGAAFAMLRFADAAGEPVPEAVTNTLRSLSQAARLTGSTACWPLGMGNEEVWTGWCHGSAGHALFWAQVHEIMSGDEALELAVMAGEHAWRSTPPPIGHLCCGGAGHAYAFLALYRLTGKGKYVDRARRRLEQATESVGTRHMVPNSLYRGDLGVALLEPELSQPFLAAMPMFESERWP